MDPQHPSQLPNDWKERLSKAYDVFAVPTLQEQREIKKVLRDRATGLYMRRRNTPESMAKAPSPYKSQMFYPAPLHNLIRVDGKGFPPDVYDRLQDYMDKRPSAARWNRETMEQINQAQGRPDAAVTVFRPVPWIINQFIPGDSVLLSPSYAGMLAAGRPRWRVITGTVPAKELFTRSNDQLMRWNWDGREPFPNGGVVLPRPAPRGHRNIQA